MNYLHKIAILNKLSEYKSAVNYVFRCRLIKQASIDVMSDVQNKPIQEPDKRVPIQHNLPAQQYLPRPFQKYINIKRRNYSSLLEGLGDTMRHMSRNLDSGSTLRDYLNTFGSCIETAGEQINPVHRYKWVLSPEAKKQEPRVIPY